MNNKESRNGGGESGRRGDSQNRHVSGSPALRLSDSVLDLRGIACPLNFVKTKIQLDKMNSGEILEVLLDSGEAIESVPPSVIEEGHEVLEQKQINNYFKLLIKKAN